jgi:hypothetical protein
MSIDIITSLINQLNNYQRDNNITQACLTNAQFLYQHIHKNKLVDNCIVKAVIATYYPTQNELIICLNHIVLEIDGVIFEPSYEYAKCPNVNYYTDYEAFMNDTFCEGFDTYYNRKVRRNQFIRMCKIAREINNTYRVRYLDNDLFTQYLTLF